MLERKCFVCGDFVCHYKNIENRQEERLVLRFLNKFKVLKSRVMNVKQGSGREIRKDRKTILRKERLKKKIQWRYKKQKQIIAMGEKGEIAKRSNSEDRIKAERR